MAYVPRPRRLLARRRGGSARSKCSSPFFPRVLKHFIAFGRLVGERRVRLELLRTGLQTMAPFQHRFLGHADFACQLRGGLPLQDPAHEQDDMLGHELAACEHGATVEGIDPLAAATAVDRQPTAGIDAEQARVLEGRVAVGQHSPVG